ncbi:hypothetical protein SADUNF_Sadunf07G0098000 [Salix dunnii]|uniref:MADS-box domain-containing protein n=1 Tax=Salix dunnii TaxID=1413687 RepID=A0A835K0N5_9ROSI|nr:hypothetical protein SADUNF_Sadunf07G0098000 [Salix dunnii]
MVRSSKGRQKLEMVKIPNDSNLMVTFSKRRSGLFKKASEIATLCGAEVTIIVFSPGKKVFSFGHPSVEKVVEQYQSGGIPPQTSGAYRLVEAHRNARICDLNMKLTQLQEELEMEKKRGEELDNLRKASQSQNWWDKPIQELDLAQLEQLKAGLLNLKQNLARQAEQVLLQNSAPRPFFSPNPGTAGILPFDTRNTGFNSNMAVAPFSSNTTMAPFNTNMMGAPFDANMTGAPFDANMTGVPYAYSLGYGNALTLPYKPKRTTYLSISTLIFLVITSIVSLIPVMASCKSFILALFIALTFTSMNVSIASRHLLQVPPLPKIPMPPLPSIPNLPQPTLPTLPTLPTTQPSLPKPTLPPLPSTIPAFPTLPKVTLPPLPSMPSIPTIPTIPSIPFLSPPPATTSP